MGRSSRAFLGTILTILAAGVATAAAGSFPGATHQSDLATPAEITDLWVDAGRGMDVDRCGVELPCRTIQTVLATVPAQLTRDITVHIAAGTYDGGIVIAGRGSTNGSRLILTGEPGLTIIAGPAGRDTGISVIHSSDVVLQNLIVQGYAKAGIRVMFSWGSHLRSLVVTGNGDGIFIGESEAWVSGSVIRDNGGNGVSCTGGWVTFGPDDPTLLQFFSGNDGAAIMAAGCHASIEGPTTILADSDGLLAVHGAEINLNMRRDIGVYAAAGGSALTADCHGMIVGYAGTCAVDCGCASSRYGICEPGLVTEGGRTRTPPVVTLP